MEGGQVTLCAMLQDLPSAGLGSIITLQLQSTSDKSGKKCITQIEFFSQAYFDEIVPNY